jgi:YD repeat-containing protein
MKSARRRRVRASFRLWLPSTSFVRSISITVGLVLIVTSLALSPLVTAFGKRPIRFPKSEGQQSNGQERRTTPLPPRLEMPPGLPNLDLLRSAAASHGQGESRIEAPRPIPSTMASPRKAIPLAPNRRPGERPRGAATSATRDERVARANSRHGRQLSHHSRITRIRTFAMSQGGDGTPYGGTPIAIPGTVEVENYNEGGSGVAYYDTTAGSHGQDYEQPPSYPVPSFRQPTDVDIYKHSGYSNSYLLLGQAGDWTKYTVNIASTGTYTLEAQVTWGGTSGTPGTFHIEVDGIDKTGPIQIPDNNWSFTTVTKTGVQLISGTHVMRIVWDTNAPNGYCGDIDKLTFTFTGSTPYSGSPIAIPGTVEIERYDNGGSGVGYYDTTAGSHGQDYDQPPNYPPPAFRQPTDVDIYKAAGGYSGDYLIVVAAGDWMKYSVNVTQTGIYTVQARVAWGGEVGGAFHLEMDGVDVTGPIQIPNSNWSLTTISKAGVQLTAGQHIMRVVADTNASYAMTGDIDYLNFTLASSAGDFAMARLNPLNRTGSGREDLLSNNFNWSLPLISLPGRGVDLGLSLSYNSLVWTRAGNSIGFDLDQGSIAPGFRLSFPVVEGPYFNDQANANFYMLVTPSGARVELRQNGSGSTVYESKDSSYLQYTDNLDGTATLRTTDGSQMRYIGVGGAWRCNRIKDRNGNYISATYKSWGELETVTDTVGRVLTFNYDANANIQSITQMWGSQTHEWATFGWGTASIGNNFPSLTNLGPNSTTIPVVTQVGLPDGSRYNFEYSNSYGIVSTIRYYASDNHQRNYTTYVAPASAIDCPRLTERRDWAEHWTGGNGVPNEVVTSFAHDADGGCRMTLPDGTVHKEYYGSSWQGGLTTETRSYATVADANSNAWQKKTTMAWTQDNPSVSYQTNPRVTETNI